MKSNWLYSVIVLSTTMCFSYNTYGQSEEIDFQTWTDFTFTYNIKNKTNIGADTGIRGLISRNDWNQFYVRPAVHYYFNRTISIGGGIGLFYTSSDALENTTELRFFEESTLAWPSFNIIKFYNRVRFEQRSFTYQQDELFGTPLPNDFEARGRYQISFETLDIHLANKNMPIYFLGAFEAFYSFNDPAIEQSVNNQRILGGLGQRLSPRLKYEIQYIFQRSRQFSDEGLKTTEHAFRLRIFFISQSRDSTEK